MVELTMLGATCLFFLSSILVYARDFVQKLDGIDSANVNNAHLFPFSLIFGRLSTIYRFVYFAQGMGKHMQYVDYPFCVFMEHVFPH